MVKKIILFMTLPFLFNCAAKPQKSVVIGQCKSLLIPQTLWKGRSDLYVGKHLITSDDDIQVGRMSTVLNELPVGTKVKVSKVFRDWSGSYSGFLRVEVEILDGSHVGLIADIPACVPHHPEPRWITNCTLDPNALIFNEDIVKDCDV